MKKNLLIFLLVILYNVAFSQTCPGVPTRYHGGCDGGECGYPQYATYDDGTRPPQHGENGDLVVTWSHGGHGYVDIFIFNALGEEFEIHTPVTIVAGPYFSAGPDYLCGGETSTLTIHDDCGTSFTWSAPDGWSINGGGSSLTTSSKSVNIQAPVTNSSGAVISVTTNNSMTINKNIQVGTPSSDQISIQGDLEVCPNSSPYTYYIQNTSGVPITESHWEMPSGFTILSQDNTSVTVSTGSDVDLQTIELTIRTACSTDLQGPWYFETEEGSCFSSFSMAPNPSSSQVEVSMPSLQPEKSIQSPSSASSNFLVQIHDRLGVPVHTSKQINNSFTLNTSDLKDGLYIVSVSNGKKVYRKTLLVKH